MKNQIILRCIAISLFVLGMLSYASVVFGATYSMGISEGDTKEYKIIVNDNNDVGGEAGDTVTVTIVSITQHHATSGGWSVTINPGNDDPGTSTLPADPSIITGLFYPSFVCPLVVKDYLAAAKTGWDNAIASINDEYEPSIQVSGTTIKLTVTDSRYDKISTDVWEVTYDPTTGWATEFKAWMQDTLLTHITEATDTSIIGYEMPILLGVAAVSIMALAVLKKRRI